MSQSRGVLCSVVWKSMCTWHTCTNHHWKDVLKMNLAKLFLKGTACTWVTTWQIATQSAYSQVDKSCSFVFRICPFQIAGPCFSSCGSKIFHRGCRIHSVRNVVEEAGWLEQTHCLRWERLTSATSKIDWLTLRSSDQWLRSSNHLRSHCVLHVDEVWSNVLWVEWDCVFTWLKD